MTSHANKATIKAVTFDFWSTLYYNSPNYFINRGRILKSTLEHYVGHPIETRDFEAAIQATGESWRAIWAKESRTLTTRERLDIVLKSLDIKLESEKVTALLVQLENSVLEQPPILVPEAKAALAELAQTCCLGLISDTGLSPGRVMRRVMAKDGILDYFTHLTFSDELGHSKPHPTTYLTTLAGLSATPAEAVHVGDLLRTDVAGAKKVGMKAVQYIAINIDKRLPDLPEPDAVIAQHTELLPLIARWNQMGQR